jgi:NDP-hexose-3-ketoreductase
VRPNTSSARRIALWGVGDHAIKSVLPAIADSVDLELVGIHTRNPKVLSEQSKSYGCLAWAEPPEMLANMSVDVIYLATPTGLHYAHGFRVLAADKDLWCEKPLTTTLKDAQHLCQMAEDNGRALAVVSGPRYHPQFNALQNQMNNGAIGSVTNVFASFHFPHLSSDNFRYNPDLGGGALLDIGFYLLSVVDALVPGELVQLKCAIETEIGYRVDTNATATLHFDDGSVANLLWGYGGDYQNFVSIIGDNGQLTATPFFSKPQNLPPYIHLSNQSVLKQRIDFNNKNQISAMFDVFCNKTETTIGRRTLVADALRSQKLLDAAIRASSQGGFVKFEN